MKERQILKLQMKNGITGQLLQYETVDERKQRIKDMFTNINSLATSAPVGRLEIDNILAMVKTGEPDFDVLKDLSDHFEIISIVLREKTLGITRKSKDEPVSAVYNISRDFGLLDNDTLLDHPGVVDAGVFYTVLAAYFKSGLRKGYDDESEKEKIQRLREVLEQCRGFYERLETYREDRKHLRRTFRFVEETFEDSMLRIAKSEEEEKEVRSLAREIRSRSLEEGLFDSRMSESEFKQILTDFLLNYIRPVFSDYPVFSRFGSLYNRFLDSAWESRLMIINDEPED